MVVRKPLLEHSGYATDWAGPMCESVSGHGKQMKEYEVRLSWKLTQCSGDINLEQQGKMSSVGETTP